MLLVSSPQEISLVGLPLQLKPLLDGHPKQDTPSILQLVRRYLRAEFSDLHILSDPKPEQADKVVPTASVLLVIVRTADELERVSIDQRIAHKFSADQLVTFTRLKEREWVCCCGVVR